MLLIGDRSIGIKLKDSQNFMAQIVTHVLATIHNVSHIQVKKTEKFPKQLICAHFVNKDDISGFTQICFVVVESFFLFFSNELDFNPDEQIHDTEDQDRFGVEISIRKVVRYFD